METSNQLQEPKPGNPHSKIHQGFQSEIADNQIFLSDVDRVSAELMMMIEGNLKINKYVRTIVVANILVGIQTLRSWLRTE